MTIEQAEKVHKIRAAHKSVGCDLKDLTDALNAAKTHLLSKEVQEIIGWSLTQVEKALYHNKEDYIKALQEI